MRVKRNAGSKAAGNGMISRLPTGLLLAGIWIVMVGVRFLLACVTHVYYTVIIDEPLYTSIARSIANGEGLLYMGQPADYSSILYPLFLAPVYWLVPEGTDYFRLLQLWNLCLLHLSVFPVYALARDVTGEKKKALLITVITLLLPDMLLGGMVMSESILFPLFFTMALFAYRFFSGGKAKYLIGVGLLGGPVDGAVSAGGKCSICWYREDFRARPVKIALEIELEEPSSFIVGFNDETYSFDLPAGKDTYNITLSSPADDVYFRAPTAI